MGENASKRCAGVRERAPMHARAASRVGRPNDAAAGVSTVAADHQTTPKPRTFLPPTRSARSPPRT